MKVRIRRACLERVLGRVFLLALVAGLLWMVSGCANQQYAGLNYGELTTPDGERWKIAGGKDETNVSLKITKPDGTTVEYHADNADASTVLKIQAETINALVGQILQLATPGVTP